MATKPSTASSVIREIIAKNPKVTVKEIVAELDRRHVKASLALVNKIKYGRQPSGKKSANRRSKADAIRSMWSTMGIGARPRDVIEALAERGVKVSSAQVGMLRTANGKRNGAAPVSLEHLMAAKKLAEHLGGIDVARRALDGLAKVVAS
jgi:hypothetical protein